MKNSKFLRQALKLDLKFTCPIKGANGKGARGLVPQENFEISFYKSQEMHSIVAAETSFINFL